jgi:hypothetical protein
MLHLRPALAALTVLLFALQGQQHAVEAAAVGAGSRHARMRSSGGARRRGTLGNGLEGSSWIASSVAGRKTSRNLLQGSLDSCGAALEVLPLEPVGWLALMGSKIQAELQIAA